VIGDQNALEMKDQAVMGHWQMHHVEVSSLLKRQRLRRRREKRGGTWVHASKGWGRRGGYEPKGSMAEGVKLQSMCQ